MKQPLISAINDLVLPPKGGINDRHMKKYKYLRVEIRGTSNYLDISEAGLYCSNSSKIPVFTTPT